MKFYSILVAAILIATSHSFTLAQSTDQLISEINGRKVYQKATNGTFYIKNKTGRTVYKNLKFVRPIHQNWQVIDQYNKSFYIDEKGKKQQKFKNFFGLCGTVPHYELTIEETDDAFVVWNDEVFYDYGNKIPATREAIIAKDVADKVFFINGTTSFEFTANYGFGNMVNPPPTTLIIEKNQQFSIFNDPTATSYDAITLERGILKTQKNGLVGVYGVCSPKYKSIGGFQHYLAVVELPNGKKGYIDNTGKEYFE